LQYGTRYLRITRRICASSTANKGDRDSNASEDEVAAVEDDDPEALATPVANHKHMRIAQCDVIYSPAYQVPVLYLTFAEHSTNKSIALPPPDEVYADLVPEDFKSPMRSVGVMGALSMAEHPITGLPSYFVHPCRTQEALFTLLQTARSGADPFKATHYLLLWFGVIGASVGLSVPINVAKQFADRSRGSVEDLGMC
jgi:ubiquitin-like-conjugating enzyme ATG10